MIGERSARALVASLVFNLLQIGWNVAIGWGLGLRLPVSAYFVFVPLTAVVLLLPAFGGLGVREMSYVGLFGRPACPRPSRWHYRWASTSSPSRPGWWVG